MHEPINLKFTSLLTDDVLLQIICSSILKTIDNYGNEELKLAQVHLAYEQQRSLFENFSTILSLVQLDSNIFPAVKAQIEKRAKENGTDFDTEKIALVGEKHPDKEFVTPEEIGALAVYLSDDMAKSITGSAISIDGGWTAQ